MGGRKEVVLRRDVDQGERLHDFSETQSPRENSQIERRQGGVDGGGGEERWDCDEEGRRGTRNAFVWNNVSTYIGRG